jgi:hypothetical protein
MNLGQLRLPLFFVSGLPPSLPDQKRHGSLTAMVLWLAKKPPRLKREYGAENPGGTKTVTAHATVSGEVSAQSHWQTCREGAEHQGHASQETCHR